MENKFYVTPEVKVVNLDYDHCLLAALSTTGLEGFDGYGGESDEKDEAD